MKKRIFLVVLFSLMLFFITGCGVNSTKDKVTGDNNSSKVSPKDFVDVSFSLSKTLLNGKYIIALMGNGDLYANGNFSNCKFEKYDVIEKNVKKFEHNNYLLVLKNNGELEYRGLSLSGGVISDFEKIFDNAIDMSTNGFTIFVIDKNNNLHARFNSFTYKTNDNYRAGISEDCSSDFVKIRENVTKAIPLSYVEGYYLIDKNENFYLNIKGEDKLIGKNIVDFFVIDYSNAVVLDKDGSVYFYKNSDGTYEKIADNAKKLSNLSFIDNDNYAYNIEDGKAFKIEGIKNVKILDEYRKNVYNFSTHDYETRIEYLSTDGKLHSSVNGTDTILSENDYKNINNDKK